MQCSVEGAEGGQWPTCGAPGDAVCPSCRHPGVESPSETVEFSAVQCGQGGKKLKMSKLPFFPMKDCLKNYGIQYF